MSEHTFGEIFVHNNTFANKHAVKACKSQKLDAKQKDN